MDHETLTWEAVDEPLPPEARLIDEGLDAFNQQAADFDAIRRFACFARSRAGEVVGGALARTWGQCCELQQVWVDEACRRHGVGRRLVGLVEEHARGLGCTLLYLETFTFQAPAFYRALGYEVACEFPGFPDGGSKFILRKELRTLPVPPSIA